MAEPSFDNSAIDALPPLKQLVESLDMRARKSLGQNFLFDLNLTRRIARSAGQLAGTTIEVGPGPGGLTRALLLENAERVIAVEKDFRAATVLDSLLSASAGRLQLVEGDALKTPLWELGSAPRRIVANLPYNIATTLLIQWLGQARAFESMTLMFQKEVASRMAKASDEISHYREYDYIVVNEDLDLSVDAVRSILAAERLRRDRQVGMTEFVRTLQAETD